MTDATTRMLHWLMALSFTGAYLSADGELTEPFYKLLLREQIEFLLRF